MVLTRSSIKPNYLADKCYNTVLACPFGIHTSLTDGIPSDRVVFLNTQAKDINETATDNGTVGYSGTAGATTTPMGVVKDGCDLTEGLTYLPGFNRDFNVTVTVLGTATVEVAAGEVVAVGANLNVDASGRAVAAGTATGFTVLSPATGAGTATNPEYVIVLIK